MNMVWVGLGTKQLKGDFPFLYPMGNDRIHGPLRDSVKGLFSRKGSMANVRISSAY